MLAGKTLVIDFRIAQVGFGGNQIRFGQGQTGFCLIDVGLATDTAGGTQGNLVVGFLVVLQVFLGQADIFTQTQDIQIGFHHFQRDLLGRAGYFISRGLHARPVSGDFVCRCKTVEKHL